jgi:hypothetical protein
MLDGDTCAGPVFLEDSLFVPSADPRSRLSPTPSVLDIDCKNWYISGIRKCVLGGCQKSGALHKMRKFYTSTTTIKRDSERERGGNRLLEMFL